MFRLLTVALCLCSLALVACSGETDNDKALRAAITFFGDDPNLRIPQVGHDYQCGINVRTPPLITPAPPATPTTAVEGLCNWSIEVQSSGWKVTFSETWLCDDYSYSVRNYPDCIQPNGFHRWEFLVNDALQVVPLSDRGAFAPDMRPS